MIEPTIGPPKLRMAKASLRAPGRPPLDPHDVSVSVTITLPSRQFAWFCARAHRAGVSVPAIIRRDLDPNKKLKTP